MATLVLGRGHSTATPYAEKKSGVRRYRILPPADNPSYVMIDPEFDGSEEAEAFAVALRRMWGTAEAQKVMQNPQLRIGELAEANEL